MVNHPINYSRGYCKSSLRRAIQKDKQQKREWFIALDPQFPSFPIVLLHENIKWPVYLRTICGPSARYTQRTQKFKKGACSVGYDKIPHLWPRIHCRELTSHQYVFSGQNVFIWKLGALEVYSLWQWFNYHHCPHILRANPSFVEEPISYSWSHISHKVSYCIPLYSMCFYWFYPILGVLNQKRKLDFTPKQIPPKKNFVSLGPSTGPLLGRFSSRAVSRNLRGLVVSPSPGRCEDFPATFDDTQRRGFF